MSRQLLLVDDDPLILAAMRRILGRKVDMETALGGREALERLEVGGPFAVVVVDMRMPGMNGLEFLMEARSRWPEMVRIMLTGNSDQATAMRAVNHGQVFRFLTKPCDPVELGLAVDAGIRQYDLVRAEKELLERTLTGSVQVLSELLGLLDPESFGRSPALRDRILQVGRQMQVPEAWNLEIAALLAPIGRVALPAQLQKKLRENLPLDVHELRVVEKTGEAGAGLLAAIPRLEEVSRILRYQLKYYDGTGYPLDGVRGADIPLGARILRAVADYTELETHRRNAAVALEALKLRRVRYDPAVLAALEACFGQPGPEPPGIQELALEALTSGMVLARDLTTRTGHPILLAGTRLNAAHLQMLTTLAELLDLQERIPITPSDQG